MGSMWNVSALVYRSTRIASVYHSAVRFLGCRVMMVIHSPHSIHGPTHAHVSVLLWTALVLQEGPPYLVRLAMTEKRRPVLIHGRWTAIVSDRRSIAPVFRVAWHFPEHPAMI